MIKNNNIEIIEKFMKDNNGYITSDSIFNCVLNSFGYPFNFISQSIKCSRYLAYTSSSNGICAATLTVLALNKSFIKDKSGLLYFDIPPIIAVPFTLFTFKILFNIILIYSI